MQGGKATLLTKQRLGNPFQQWCYMENRSCESTNCLTTQDLTSLHLNRDASGCSAWDTHLGLEKLILTDSSPAPPTPRVKHAILLQHLVLPAALGLQCRQHPSLRTAGAPSTSGGSTRDTLLPSRIYLFCKNEEGPPQQKLQNQD